MYCSSVSVNPNLPTHFLTDGMFVTTKECKGFSIPSALYWCGWMSVLSEILEGKIFAACIYWQHFLPVSGFSSCCFHSTFLSIIKLIVKFIHAFISWKCFIKLIFATRTPYSNLIVLLCFVPQILIFLPWSLIWLKLMF